MPDVSPLPTDTPLQPPSQSPPVQPPPEPPFVLELRYEELQPNGTFTPQAALLLTPALRRSSLLQMLTTEELRTLIAALSCLTPNGTFAATPELVAPALGLSIGQAKDRLQRLTKRLWQEKPLLSEQPIQASQGTPSGLRFFVPGPLLFAVRHSYVLPHESMSAGDLTALLRDRGQPMQGGFRQQIIANSRTNYTRPRAEVEAQINRFLRGEYSHHEPMEEKEEIPATPEEETRLLLKRQLIALGITSPEATLLLDTYPQERIQQQLEWLPLRHARNPAGFLLAAIEGDYDPPMAVRLQQLKHCEEGESRVIANQKTQQEEPAVESEIAHEVKSESATRTDEEETISLELPPEGTLHRVSHNASISGLSNTKPDGGHDATRQDAAAKDSP